MLAFGVALVGAGAIVLNASGVGGGAPIAIFIGLFVAFALPALSSVRVFGPRHNWKYGPMASDLVSLIDDDELGDGDVTRVVGDVFSKAVDKNEVVLKRKARAIWVGMVGLTLETIALAGLATLVYWPT